MVRKKYVWRDEYDYQRVLEILNDYWVTEQEEEKVVVDMKFKKSTGETQHKTIYWENPELRKERTSKEFEHLETTSFNDLISTCRCDRCTMIVPNESAQTFPLDEWESIIICDRCISEMYWRAEEWRPKNKSVKEQDDGRAD